MITLAFSTFNGSRTLPSMLESLTTLTPPQGGWEIIAVDNASTDNSSAIINSYKKKLPLKLLHQPKQGKNFALNLALPYCLGEIIVFTDDDILASPDLLLGYERLLTNKLDYTVFGGKIIPHWPDDKPEAIVKTIPLGPAYSLHKEDMHSGPTDPGMVWGANMAIRSDVFKKGARFNECIGPSIGSYIMGSETELNFRLAEAGHLFWFEDSIVVKHQIRPEQLSHKWLAGRAQRFGRANAFNDHKRRDRSNMPIVFGAPRWQYRALVEGWLIKILGILSGNEETMLKGLWNSNFYRGAIYENRKLSSQRVPPAEKNGGGR
ncbi:glycosyltransferase [Marinobacter halotolerans]|uniref:glycosyltransferase n=1 Tax=Marinobacter halotolerans TaxID=1569211 RepID=UPI0012487D7E|nr:glycosyltransferase family 2 protein [Marinobacter halotolerans]